MIQLMQALFSTMRFEPQPKLRDSSTRPAVVETESAPPVTSEQTSEENTRSMNTLGVGGELKKLEEVFGPFKTGLCINVTLRDLLQIIPRKRRRSDAYRGLQKALSEMGVELTIKSQKDGKQI